jgi:hypothetical protein
MLYSYPELIGYLFFNNASNYIQGTLRMLDYFKPMDHSSATRFHTFLKVVEDLVDGTAGGFTRTF